MVRPHGVERVMDSQRVGSISGRAMRAIPERNARPSGHGGASTSALRSTAAYPFQIRVHQEPACATGRIPSSVNGEDPAGNGHRRNATVACCGCMFRDDDARRSPMGNFSCPGQDDFPSSHGRNHAPCRGGREIRRECVPIRPADSILPRQPCCQASQAGSAGRE